MSDVLVSNCHLSLGYGSGPGTFANMARLQGVKLDMTPESIVKAYRDAMSQVKGMWKKAQDAIPSMLLDGGAEIDELGMITTVHEGIRLPSGRILRYPNLRQEVEENPEPGKRAKREWLCDGSRAVKRLYGGLLVENCLSADAAVVTDSGVKRITEVTLADRLWDGVEFVNHRGLLYKGVQQTLPVGGVYMTPDHMVLTRRGWVEAREVTHAEAALESERLNRKAFRPPAGTWVRLFQRWKNMVGGAMCLREPDCEGGGCHGKRGRSVLRLLAHGGVAQPKITRHEQAPGLRHMAQHVRPVSSPDASSMEELRGPRYYCVRAVECLRALLGGHGSYVPARIDAGPARQRKGVLRRELPVGSLHRASSEQKELDTGGYAGGTENHSGVSAAVQYARKYGAIPVSRRSPVARDSVTTERREEPVFDLMDAGPRNRFAVVCPAGGTIIVHNCNQAVARDVITDHALEIHRDISPVRHVVHDEIVVVVDADAAKDALEEMGRVMARPLDYWPELPLASEGDIAERYGDAK